MLVKLIEHRILSFLALIFVALAIVGGIKAYSPVPFWDMWDGYLGFYDQLSEGNWSVWWSQHNEHRIVLSRILFWIDFEIFRGQVWFLIVINYMLASTTCWLFWQCCKLLDISNEKWTVSIIVIATFSWVQYQNFTWGFQSQFFLAQILPLAALVEISKATYNPKRHLHHYTLALLFAILSVGSMANGVLALPLLTAYYAVYHRHRKVCLCILMLVTAISWLSYFFNYTSPGHHGSMFLAITDAPLEIIHYIFLYFGSPVYYFSGANRFSLWIASLAGIVFVISYIILFAKAFSLNRVTPIVLSLNLFILYIGGTALGTAGGRIVFGVEQALASRYTTPALMAWIGLLLLFIYQICNHHKLKLHLSSVMLVIGLLMLPAQSTALFPEQVDVSDQLLSGLAITLNVQDRKQINKIAPSVERAIELSAIAKEKKLSIFSASPINLAHEIFGKTLNHETKDYRVCDVRLEEIVPITADDNFIRVSGWISELNVNGTFNHAYIVDGNRLVVGFVLMDEKSAAEIALNGLKRNALSFAGYALAGVAEKDLYLVSPDQKCKALLDVPRLYFSVKVLQNGLAPTVSVDQIDSIVEWVEGGDPFRTKLDGISVYGSFINGDFDKGKLFVTVKNGDWLMYRSGPSVGKQFISILGVENTQWVLPVAEDWVQLHFSFGALDGYTVLEFIDAGESWGEWSSVGLAD